jgi:hypothetical protein
MPEIGKVHHGWTYCVAMVLVICFVPFGLLIALGTHKAQEIRQKARE